MEEDLLYGDPVTAALQLVGQIGASTAQSNALVQNAQLAAQQASLFAAQTNLGTNVFNFAQNLQAQSQSNPYAIVGAANVNAQLEQLQLLQTKNLTSTPETDNTKKILLYSGIGVGVLALAIGGYFLFK